MHRVERWTQRLAAWVEFCERRPRRALALLAPLLLLQVSPWWYATPDGTAYLSIARSIAGADHVAALGNAQLGFPIGYPLLISPAFLVADRPFLLLSLLHAAAAVVLLAGVYRWSVRVVPEAAWLLTALVGANVNVGNLYRRTLSEVAFLPLMIWTANLLNAAVVPHRRDRPARAWPLAVLLLLATVVTREAGLCLAAGLAALALLDRRTQQPARAWFALACLVPLGLFAAARFLLRPERMLAAWRAVAASFATASPNPSGWVTPLLDGLRERTIEAGQLVVPGMFKAYSRSPSWIDLHLLVFLPVCALMAWGWVRLLRRQPDVLAWSALFYLALHLIWPYGASARYLLPLLPLLFASLWTVLPVAPGRRRAIFALLLAGHLGVAIGYAIGIDLPRARACHHQWPAVTALAERLPPDSQVAVSADVPACVWLMLQLQRDRPMLRPAPPAAAAPRVEYLVASASAPPVVGFTPQYKDDQYVLLRRHSPVRSEE